MVLLKVKCKQLIEALFSNEKLILALFTDHTLTDKYVLVIILVAQATAGCLLTARVLCKHFYKSVTNTQGEAVWGS